jgi:hypothetical protein
MTSHEYAKLLQERAEYLLGKPEFNVPKYTGGIESMWYMWDSDKPDFLAAVVALGSGDKKVTNEYVEFHPKDAPVYVKINKSAVCKLVKPAEYDCIPLLSQVEEEQVGNGA